METLIERLSRMGRTKRVVLLVLAVLVVYAATIPLDMIDGPPVGPMLRGLMGAGSIILGFLSAPPDWQERNDPRNKWPLPGRRWGLAAILLVWLAFIALAGGAFPAAATETANATVVVLLLAVAVRGPMDPEVSDDQVATWEWRNPFARGTADDDETEEPDEDKGGQSRTTRLVNGLRRPGARSRQATGGRQDDLDELVALASADPEEAALQVAGDAALATRLHEEQPELSDSLRVLFLEMQAEDSGVDGGAYLVDDGLDEAGAGEVVESDDPEDDRNRFDDVEDEPFPRGA